MWGLQLIREQEEAGPGLPKVNLEEYLQTQLEVQEKYTKHLEETLQRCAELLRSRKYQAIVDLTSPFHRDYLVVRE